MVQKNAETPFVVCGEGQERRVMSHGGGLMVCEIRFQSGAGGGALHHHPHRQVSYVASGVFEYTIEDKTERMVTGDSIMVEPDLPHGCRCIEAGTLIDVFTPEREDFLK